MNTVYLLLGGNMDDRAAWLEKAKDAICLSIGKIVAQSSLYESEPWGFQAEKCFLNQVVKTETDMKPAEILNEILSIENKLGRIRNNTGTYQSRTIDIDILFYNDQIITEMNLVIPHPRIQERMFTLVPLAELDQSFVHPASRKTIGQLINECTDSISVCIYHPD